MDFPLVEQVTDGHQPDLRLGAPKLCDAVINQAGKDLIVFYPPCVFFGSPSSLSERICRAVPLNMASVMAVL